MRNVYFSLIALAMLMPQMLCAQKAPWFNNVQYFIGTGSKTALFVVDFNNGNSPECLTWGYRFNGTPTAEQMLKAIDSADARLKINISSGFLNDILYLNYSGIGGSPNYWATFTYNNINAQWNMNMGISEILSDSMIFGASYTAWNGADPVYLPENPVPVSISNHINPAITQLYIGTGSKTAFLVTDFNDGTANDCYIIGYKFDGVPTAEKMLKDIDSADARFSILIAGGFLSNLSFLSHNGIGGSPNYWSSFTYDRDSIKWDMNMGLSEILSDSTIFGVSYTAWDANWNPIFVPENPAAVVNNAGVANMQEIQFDFFPNPAQNYLTISSETEHAELTISDLNGKIIINELTIEKTTTINLSSIAPGTYYLRLKTGNSSSVQKLIVD